MDPPPTSSPWIRLGPWGPRLVAGLLAALFFTTLLVQMPPGERRFVSPDDGDALRYGLAILEHGRPILTRDEVAPAGANLTVILPPGTFESPRGEFASVRPPAYFFLLALPATAGAQGIFIAAAFFAGLSLLAIYAVLERVGGGTAAVAGLALLAFHPSTLFWSHLPRSNVVALGVLMGFLRLLLSRRFVLRALGAGLLATMPLWRFEFAIVGAILGLWWLVQEWPTLRRSRKQLAQLGVALALGILITLGASWSFYGTIDLRQAQTGFGTAGEDVGDAETSDLERVEASYGQVAVLIAIPLVASLVLLRPGSFWPAGPLMAAALVVLTLVLRGQFAQQPVFMLESLTRYLLVTVLAAAVAMAQPWRTFTRVTKSFVVAAIVLSGAAGVILAGGEDGFGGLRAYTAPQEEFLAVAGDVPADAVFVGPYAGNALPQHHALYFERVIDPAERKSVTQAEVFGLLQQGIPVVGSHTRAGAYASWVAQDPRMDVRDLHPGFWEAFIVA